MRVQTPDCYPGLMPSNPDTGREDESITLAQFLMQAVNSSIIWVQSLNCTILKSDENRFCIDFRRKCSNVQYFMAGRDILSY